MKKKEIRETVSVQPKTGNKANSLILRLKKAIANSKTSKMKSKVLLAIVCLLTIGMVQAQTKWEQLTDEQKLEKLKSFRAENQKYLKDTLKLTATQMTDLDNVNVCFLSTLDRVERYGKNESNKEQFAQALWDVRWIQVDAIMGKEKHEKYAAYIKRKIETAISKKEI